MTLSPARDSDNHAMPTLIVVPIEGPSYSWEVRRWGTASHFFHRTQYMECRGHGPLTMDSIDMTYRDCTPPDLTHAQQKKWSTR